MKRALISFVIIFLCGSIAVAEEKKPLKPSPKDKCPVCGMFVAKYPDWVAEIVFRDGSIVFFDGCKDMFKYYFDMKKYTPKKTRADIDSIFLIEYYDFKFVDGMQAYYVLGSDVFGPMGRELIPFAKEADANEFLKDHKGKRVLKFKDVTQETLKLLE
ncbi:MAG TPA: nitrous oxide reductase accessory protein NosL [Thermodesulfovibrionales bacterium]|nr:nitrous oxide reductase accessory protein NosL [Thermodesulfovibrionales bacterium]